MANVAGMCSSFKGELLAGLHAIGFGPTRTTGVADTIKGALFTAAASRAVTDTVYNATGELAASGNYTQGGKTITFGTAPTNTTTTGWVNPTANLLWTAADTGALTSSAAFDCLVVYNSTQGSKQISVHTFSSQSITAGDFTLTMPAAAAATALLRIT